MPRTRPLVFIGSSTEGLHIAKSIQAELVHVAESVLWCQGIFGLSEGPLESLVKALPSFDFAILVLTPDDLVASRGDNLPAPRDNVLLELGLFIGGLGRDRTFMLGDHTAKMKLPSDLAGLTAATYQPPERGTWRSAVGPACTAIADTIRNLGPCDAALSVTIVGAYEVNAASEKSILFKVTNRGTEALPPYTVSVFHPKLGHYFMFPSTHSGPLLPHQTRVHRCVVITDGSVPEWFPRFTHARDNTPLSALDDNDFSLQLVLEHSDQVLYENTRIAKALIMLLRKTREHGSEIGGEGGGTFDDWAELSTC